MKNKSNTPAFRLTSIFTTAAAVLALSACQSSTAPSSEKSSESETTDRAAADIGDLRDGGKQVTSIRMPDGFKKGDKVVAYEGPGWESDKVAYRIYLDGRNALDIFGKKTPDMVLSSVGRGDDYHKMADWGMDILKVGNSLGAGGFGVFENGEVRQIGNAESYGAEVVNDTNEAATVKVTHYNSESCGGDVAGFYTAKAGEYLTHVRVEGDCALPYAAGIVDHKEANAFIESSSDEPWQYIASHGPQSLVPDNLGIAIFYKKDDVKLKGKDSDEHFILFRDGIKPSYITGAIWSQDNSETRANIEFIGWLNTTLTALNASAAN